MQPRLSQGAVVEVERRVDEMFNRLLTRLLGGHFTGKHLFITVDPSLSIPALFANAVTEEGGKLDRDLLQNMADVVKHLVDKQRADAKATTVRRIQMLLEDVKAGRLQPENFRNAVESELTESWGRISSNVERVVDTESQHAVTIGLKDGIEQMNAARGIDDPVYVFIPKQDTALCAECRRTHLIDTTPRCWYGSEVSSDYHQRGEDRPSWHRMHPHCRCALATVLPGFGFSADGRVTFITDGFLELEYQRASGGALGGVDERRKWAAQDLGKAERKVDLSRFCAGDQCYVQSEGVERKYPHLKQQQGFFVRPDGTSADHAWNQGPDGTIYDVTFSQFNPKVQVGMFAPGTPEHAQYRSYEEHHPLEEPKRCLLRALGRPEKCEAPGCDWRGRSQST